MMSTNTEWKSVRSNLNLKNLFILNLETESHPDFYPITKDFYPKDKKLEQWSRNLKHEQYKFENNVPFKIIIFYPIYI